LCAKGALCLGDMTRVANRNVARRDGCPARCPSLWEGAGREFGACGVAWISSSLRRQEELFNSEAGHPVLFALFGGVAICHFECRAFRPPAEGELLLFCLSKREVTKRKGHPAWRFLSRAQKVREARPGFSTAHPCAGEKESTSCRSLFVRTGVLSKSPVPPHGRAGQEARQAPSGVAFPLWLLSLYSGHPALRPSGQLRCSRSLLRARGHAKRK